MIKRNFFLLTILFSFSISAAEDWITVAEIDTTRWDGRAKSLTYGTTKGGKEMTVAAGRVFNKKEKSFVFEKWYVLNEDCLNGYGKLVTLDMQGTYKYETDFVEKGGSVASGLAALLCNQLIAEKKEREEKGI